MSSMAVEVPANVLEVLALPALETLADARVRGAACTWCGDQLTGETAVDLGEQLTPLAGTTSPMRWFPRACRTCVADRAHRGLFAHAPSCALCTSEKKSADCIVGRGLYRLLRNCWQ
jgi:hypothetical protein